MINKSQAIKAVSKL
jgi:hypothetical protein